MNGKVISFGYFISSVPIDHSYPFAAEICGILDVMITVDYNLIKHPNSSTSMTITVRSDFQSAIYNL